MAVLTDDNRSTTANQGEEPASRLKILIPMLFYYPDHPSGGVRLAYDEAVYLSKLGHMVWVITQDPTGEQPEYTFRDGLHVLQYTSPQLSLFDPRRITIHQQLTQQRLAEYIPQGVHVVHGHSLLHYAGALRQYGDTAKRIYTVHSPLKLEMQASSRGASAFKKLYYTLNGQLNHRIERYCLENSDIITSDSSFTRQVLGDLHAPAIQARTQVVPGWVDTLRFQIADDRVALKRELGWPQDKPLLFTLRRLVPRNGVDRLLHALKLVKDAGFDFHMMIGGKGPLQAELETLSAELGLQDHVTLFGFIPDETLPRMYAAADVFILPTSALECFGLPTLEAMATGRPVLATPVAAIPEVLRQIEPAWLADDASAEAIARIIIAYLRDELPSHPPEALRHFVINQYAQAGVLEQLTQLVLQNTVTK